VQTAAKAVYERQRSRKLYDLSAFNLLTTPAEQTVAMDLWKIVVPGLACTGLAAWGALDPRSQLFGLTQRRVERGCALTFDDGPNPEVTPRLLSLLDRYAVPATFFVLGKYVCQHPELTLEISARHQIGNHTYAHPNLLLMTRRQIRDELNRCEDAIIAATGKRTSYVRPPFGFRGPQFDSAAHKAGFSRTVMWSVSAHDWNVQPPASVGWRLQKVGQGDIVLLHDGDHRTSNADRSHMLKALEYWLPRWKDSGLEFVSVRSDTEV
jgi:peptidoglycan-N-acetylglucosamine deacetylase